MTERENLIELIKNNKFNRISLKGGAENEL